jgi:hypothetical protein
MPVLVLHLVKLAVGAKDVAQIRTFQAHRARTDPPLRHRTRMMPKRVAEITEGGGSLYWVVAGFVQVRQRILEIREEEWEGRRGAGLVLDPVLVPVAARAMKPFQGWRYLAPEAAPPDLPQASAEAKGMTALPEAMLRELRDLGLL